MSLKFCSDLMLAMFQQVTYKEWNNILTIYSLTLKWDNIK